LSCSELQEARLRLPEDVVEGLRLPEDVVVGVYEDVAVLLDLQLPEGVVEGLRLPDVVEHLVAPERIAGGWTELMTVIFL
jgi:hypothetical protein